MIVMICRPEGPEGIGLLFPPWEILRRASPHNQSGGYPELVSLNKESLHFYRFCYTVYNSLKLNVFINCTL
jgi:hypothetical protein